MVRRSTYVSLFLFLFLFLGAASAVPIAGASEPGDAPAAPMPLVFRGEAVSGAASGNAAVAGLAVPVLRGQAVADDARPAAAGMESIPDAGGGSAMPWRVVGGEKLWFVDLDSGRVIACRERNTAIVGRRAIECTGRTPRALAR